MSASDDSIRDRAAEIGARPDVKRWIARLRKLAKDMPPDVAVYCESGDAYVMARVEGGGAYVTGSGREDRNAIVARVPRGPHGGGWDGGGW